MAVEGVKISSCVAHVFTNGASKEVKEQTTSNLTNSGSTAAGQSQKSALISTLLIQN